MKAAAGPTTSRLFKIQVEVPELEDLVPEDLKQQFGVQEDMSIRKVKERLFVEYTLRNKKLDLHMMSAQLKIVEGEINFNKFIDEATKTALAQQGHINTLQRPPGALPPGLLDEEAQASKEEAVKLYKNMVRSIADEVEAARREEEKKRDTHNNRVQALMASTPAERFASAVRQVVNAKPGQTMDWPAYQTGTEAEKCVKDSTKDPPPQKPKKQKRVFTKAQQAARKFDRSAAPRPKNGGAPSSPWARGDANKDLDPKGKGKGKDSSNPKGKGKNGKGQGKPHVIASNGHGKGYEGKPKDRQTPKGGKRGAPKGAGRGGKNNGGYGRQRNGKCTECS